MTHLHSGRAEREFLKTLGLTAGDRVQRFEALVEAAEEMRERAHLFITAFQHAGITPWGYSTKLLKTRPRKTTASDLHRMRGDAGDEEEDELEAMQEEDEHILSQPGDHDTEESLKAKANYFFEQATKAKAALSREASPEFKARAEAHNKGLLEMLTTKSPRSRVDLNTLWGDMNSEAARQTLDAKREKEEKGALDKLKKEAKALALQPLRAALVAKSKLAPDEQLTNATLKRILQGYKLPHSSLVKREMAESLERLLQIRRRDALVAEQRSFEAKGLAAHDFWVAVGVVREPAVAGGGAAAAVAQSGQSDPHLLGVAAPPASAEFLAAGGMPAAAGASAMGGLMPSISVDDEDEEEYVLLPAFVDDDGLYDDDYEVEQAGGLDELGLEALPSLGPAATADAGGADDDLDDEVDAQPTPPVGRRWDTKRIIPDVAAMEAALEAAEPLALDRLRAAKKAAQAAFKQYEKKRKAEMMALCKRPAPRGTLVD